MPLSLVTSHKTDYMMVDAQLGLRSFVTFSVPTVHGELYTIGTLNQCPATSSGGALVGRRTIGELGWRVIRFHYGNSIYLLRDLKLLG